jgi:hypothetical protein
MGDAMSVKTVGEILEALRAALGSPDGLGVELAADGLMGLCACGVVRGPLLLSAQDLDNARELVAEAREIGGAPGLRVLARYADSFARYAAPGPGRDALNEYQRMALLAASAGEPPPSTKRDPTAPRRRKEDEAQLAADLSVELPAYVRKGLGVKPGDYVAFVPDGRGQFRVMSAARLARELDRAGSLHEIEEPESSAAQVAYDPEGR